MKQLTNRRTFCAALGSTSILLGMRTLASAMSADKHPNIVYILTDDLGWGDLRAYNQHTAIPTPNLNTFAREGMRFTDMHASSAVCTPSRYSVLTGRYPWRSALKSGITIGDSPDLIEPGRMTVPAMLKKAGYYTAGVGKWHLGLGGSKKVHSSGIRCGSCNGKENPDPGDGEKTDFTKPLIPGPISNGFDYFFGIPVTLDMGPYLYFENDHVVEPATIPDPGKKDAHPWGDNWRPGMRAANFDRLHALPFLTDKAVEFLRGRATQPNQPFFLYFALPSPHTPWVPLPEYRGKSKAGDRGDWVVETDAMIGRILDELESSGLSQNTLLIITSDNGADWKPIDIEEYPHRANGDWRGEKADIWEAGHRIPFLARWPGHIPPGTVNNELASLTDLMSTLAAILDIQLPPDAGEDSFNLLPALLNKKHAPIRSSIVAESIDGMLSIREGEWKLELGLGSGGFTSPQRVQPVPGGVTGQLYNLADDPREIYNLYEARPDIVAHLTKLLDTYKEQGHSRY